MKYLTLLTIALTLLLAACEQSRPRSGGTAISDEEAPRIGYYAPNFRLPTLNGETMSLASLSGKIVFINFWATWCTPCKAEMPSMEALYQDYKDQGLEILAVSNDIEGARVIRPFVEEMGLSYPILLDPDFRVDDKYLVRSVPTTVLVDRDGIITHRIVGSRNWHASESRDLIEQLLRAK